MYSVVINGSSVLVDFGALTVTGDILMSGTETVLVLSPDALLELDVGGSLTVSNGSLVRAPAPTSRLVPSEALDSDCHQNSPRLVSIRCCESGADLPLVNLLN